LRRLGLHLKKITGDQDQVADSKSCLPGYQDPIDDGSDPTAEVLDVKIRPTPPYPAVLTRYLLVVKADGTRITSPQRYGGVTKLHQQALVFSLKTQKRKFQQMDLSRAH
jgi:hypothetical protein